MDYEALARAMLSKMYTLNKTRPQRTLNEAMRGETFVLQYIIHSGGPVLPSEISHFMNISTARTAAALNSLERKGLVTRRIDPADRRRILVELTGQGKAFASEKQAHMLLHATKMLEQLGETDSVELLRILGRVTDIMAKLHEELGDC